MNTNTTYITNLGLAPVLLLELKAWMSNYIPAIYVGVIINARPNINTALA